jgi:hypothetical protein
MNASGRSCSGLRLDYGAASRATCRLRPGALAALRKSARDATMAKMAQREVRIARFNHAAPGYRLGPVVLSYPNASGRPQRTTAGPSLYILFPDESELVSVAPSFD